MIKNIGKARRLNNLHNFDHHFQDSMFLKDLNHDMLGACSVKYSLVLLGHDERHLDYLCVIFIMHEKIVKLILMIETCYRFKSGQNTT